MKKIQYLKIISSILLTGLAPLLLFIYSCTCDEKVYLAVMAGARGERDCAQMTELAREDLLPGLTYACPGDTVTICWAGNVNSNEIEPNIGSVGNAGSKQIVVTKSMTVKIIPQNSCASSKEFKIEVLNGETASTWDARWTAAPRSNNKCDYLIFKISPYFMSANIRVVKAEAKFKVTDATNSPCKFPPFLTGKNITSLTGSGILLNKPFEQVSFSIPPPAVGDWIFDFDDPNCKVECKEEAVLPFELTLMCPDR
jgi:hypothetical protein